jgi:hypothetical protein
MSQENVEIVRKAIEAGNRRDRSVPRALWHNARWLTGRVPEGR